MLDSQVMYNLSVLKRRRGCLTWKLPENSVLFSSCNTKPHIPVCVLRRTNILPCVRALDCLWNVTAHAQKPDFVFPRNGRVHLNRRFRQFSRLLAAELCASAVVTLDTPCSEVVWRVQATYSNRQFPLHFPSRASPCAITFQLDSSQLPLCSSRRCWGIRRRCATWIGVLRPA